MNADAESVRLERVPCPAPACRNGSVTVLERSDDDELSARRERCAVCAGTGRILREASEQ